MQLRRSADRFVSRGPGIESRHGFSTGRHYDPAHTSYGRLVACDEHVVAPGAGFPPHRHQELEILTWVAEGQLEHTDDAGAQALTDRATAALTTAGAGVVHAEVNAGESPLRFVQLWLLPDQPGRAPAYAGCDVAAALELGTPVPLAGPDGPLPLQAGGARLWALRPLPGRGYPTAGAAYVQVVHGEVDVAGIGRLSAGDSVRSPEGLTLTGTLTGNGAGAEVLVLEQPG